MDTLQWVKPLLATEIPDGCKPEWDSVNQVWIFIPRETWNPSPAVLVDATNSSNTIGISGTTPTTP